MMRLPFGPLHASLQSACALPAAALLRQLWISSSFSSCCDTGGAGSSTCAAALTAAAAAAAPAWHGRRHLHSAASLQQSKTEDFDLIAPDLGLARIDGLDDTGFIVNDVQVEGSIMLAGDVFTLWRVRRMADMTLDTLSLLHLLKPVPDLLVLGCGRTVQQLPHELSRQLHEMGVRVDAMDTANAVATFNVLNQEGRKVVGALLPQGTID